MALGDLMIAIIEFSNLCVFQIRAISISLSSLSCVMQLSFAFLQLLIEISIRCSLLFELFLKVTNSLDKHVIILANIASCIVIFKLMLTKCVRISSN